MIRQTQLAEEQTRLARRQTEIIENQEKLLARRATLVMRAGRSRTELTKEDRIWFQLLMHNDGHKTASDYEYEIFIPEAANGKPSRLPNADARGSVTIDGARYLRIVGYSVSALYPKRHADIIEVDFAKPARGTRRSVTLLWEAVAEDGVFPGEDKPDGTTIPGRLTLELVGD